MVRIGRKTLVDGSVIYCNGYELFIKCSCWTVHKDGVYIDTGKIHTLEDMIKWCMDH